MTGLTWPRLSQVQGPAMVHLGAAEDGAGGRAGVEPSSSVRPRSIQKGPEARLEARCLERGSDIGQGWMMPPDLSWSPRTHGKGWVRVPDRVAWGH